MLFDFEWDYIFNDIQEKIANINNRQNKLITELNKL